MKQNLGLIGIIGAMDEEINEYLALAENLRGEKWQGFEFYLGQIAGKNVLIAKSGLGKVFAALVCQKIINTYGPQKIIFTGLAGALNKNLEIGDVVVSRDCMYHDMEAEALGYSRGAIPYTDYKIFAADENLKKIALETQLPNNKVVEGRILTGDQFITRAKILEFSYLTDELQGDAVEMEGAAVAHVCTVNQIPFVIARTISDKADSEAGIDFNNFLGQAAKNSVQIIQTILSKL
ncbi:5'-methylthioadenosine/adenosylhomocysteine nucleosidase [Candidatus Kuenenbacteria bacterium]|nr:5'-methylthioadenosine/adenosylhomocysteine nucleosidase [Candidatus Kuenenbacteria bacterium]